MEQSDVEQSDLRYCNVPVDPVRPVPDAAPAEELRAIRQLEKAWVNGSTIRYAFVVPANFGGPLDEFKRTVREAMGLWSGLGIGLQLLEVDRAAASDVRIGFEPTGQLWSAVGTDVKLRGIGQLTMNLGWGITSTDGRTRWFRPRISDAIHEIGHTLGLSHEHQNPNAGIVWDEDAVYEYFTRTQGWDRNTVFWNILRKIEPRDITGSTWDPESVMHYGFLASHIEAPEPYASKGVKQSDELSAADIEWATKFYPPLEDKKNDELPLGETVWFNVDSGKQLNLTIKPPASGSYWFETHGTADTVMVLFLRVREGAPEGQEFDEQQLGADDDSGTDRNARFRRYLHVAAGSEYVLRVRLYYAADNGSVGVSYVRAS